MAVEIKEFIIKAVAVSDDRKEGGRPETPKVDSGQLPPEVIQACVREVLKILDRKAAR